MTIVDFLGLVGGVALFLLGMNLMGEGLEKACGNKMKSILEKLTSNRFIGVLVGMIITMVIQSSSATTVMVVGFVNAGMMGLSQAVWVIMGANIGTTITGQLVALDVGIIAPVFAILGVIFMLFVKKPILNEIGKILSGFGILFIGMDMMSSAMSPLRESEEFIGLMTKFSNPFLGILVGAVFTAIIQSSSASVGILQALAISGVITLDSAVYVLFGQNIGTCITAVISSIGTNRNAKRTTLIHLMFNAFGTLVFTIICLTTPLVNFMIDLTPNAAQQIANMHTLFNITTTLLLLPLGTYLVKIAEKILPDRDVENKSIFMYLNNDINATIGGSAIHLENVRLEIKRMYEISKNNIVKSFDAFINQDVSDTSIIDSEKLVDELNDGITKQITACLSKESNAIVSEAYSSYLIISNNIERLSDHAMNFYEYCQEFIGKNLKLNEMVKEELILMKQITVKMLDVSLEKQTFNEAVKLENDIDDMTEKYHENMIKRLKNSVCTAEGSVIYSSVLVDFERIGDHLLNIAENNLKIML